MYVPVGLCMFCNEKEWKRKGKTMKKIIDFDFIFILVKFNFNVVIFSLIFGFYVQCARLNLQISVSLSVNYLLYRIASCCIM